MTETLEQFQARLTGAAISTYILVMFVVPLKLWCRASSSRWRSLGLDDYLCVAALACANAFFYVCMYGKFSLDNEIIIKKSYRTSLLGSGRSQLY